jgi:hypothetical protein
MSNEGERYDLPIAVGDHVRPLRRIYPGTVKDGMIANNGDVLQVLDVSPEALTVRNAEGRQARLEWKVLSDSGSPLRLAPGYAATIDSQQGITSTEHINVIASGSSAVQGFKNYVAESRHRVASWMIVNESAERQQIRDKRPANDWTKINADDVWANIAKNLSRQPTKSLAMDFLRGATSVHRGTITQRFAGRVHQELAAAKEASDKPGRSVWTASADLERRRVSRAPALRRVAEQAREIALQGIEKLHLEARQARGPRL